ncbi:hypothetical protein KAX14_03315 [Candidatus Bipolaricaulota bacterium]|nr:hypothetical protein [Candidatus Bipolaricaulota bacterium]
MKTTELLHCDLQNREWINERLEQLTGDYKGSYIAVHNREIVATAGTIPAIRTAIKKSTLFPMLPMSEVTISYLPDKPVAMVL